MKKLKTKALLLIALAGALTMTGCDKELNPSGDEGKDGKDQVTRLSSIAFKEASVTLEEEGSLDLIIQYNPENVPSSQKGIKYSSSDESIVIVDENFGTISGVSAGKATITATSLVNPSIKATCEVTVTAKDRSIPVERIVLDPDSATIAVGRYTYVNAKVLGANNAYATDSRLTWVTDHPEIATIDSATRKITGISAGNAVITATSVADPSISATIQVVVTDNYVAVANVSVDKESVDIQVINNPSATLTATITGEGGLVPTDSRLSWSVTTGEDFVSVIPTSLTSAQIRAKAQGTAVVRVSSVDDPEIYDETVVHVAAADAVDPTVHATGIHFTNDNEVTFGHELDIVAVVTPSGANPNYHLQKKSGYTLPEGTTFDSETGKVHAGNKEGSFVVEAIAEDDANGQIKAEMIVYVKDPIVHVDNILSSITSTTIYVDDTLNLANGSGLISVSPSNATNPALEYESSNPSCVTVDPDTGLLKAIAKTSEPVTITIKSVQDSEKEIEIEVNVLPTPVSRVILNAYSKSMYSGETFVLTPTIKLKSPNRDEEDTTAITDVSQMTFEVTSGSDVASVSPAGVISALKNGNATVQVYLTADPSVKATCTVAVTTRKPLVMSLNLQNDLQSYERKTDVDNNMTPVENLSTNGSASKSEFFQDSEENLMYKVGTVGEFQFAPVVKARIYNDAGVDIGTETYNDAEIDYKYYLDGSETPLESNEVADYLTKTATGYTFTSAAIDHVFEIKMNVKQSENYDVNGNVPNDFKFKVIKGYNAYTVEELSFISNVSDSSTINWAQIREDSGMNLPSFDASKDGAVILQKDINITSSILPESMLWTEESVDNYIGTPSGKNDFQAWKALIGVDDNDEAKELLYNSPKDYVSLFMTKTYSDEDNFAIEGNFFTINTSDLNQVRAARDDGYHNESLIDFQNGDGSHAQVFGVNVSGTNNLEDPKGSYTVNNLKFIGNGAIQTASAKAAAETDQAKKNRLLGDIRLAKGGYIAYKASDTRFTVRNCINTGSFIGYMSERHGSTNSQTDVTVMNLDRVKAYDSYNSMLYFFGSQLNTMTNCWFNGAGGPLVFMDEPWFGDVNENHQRSAGEFINCYLDNPVTGAEPWFEQHHASALIRGYLVDAGNPNIDTGWYGKLAQIIQQINGEGDAKTITGKVGSNTVVNLIALDLCANHFLEDAPKKCSGKFLYKDTQEEDGFALDLAKVDKDSSYHTTLVDNEVSKMIIETSGNGKVYVNEGNVPSYMADAAGLDGTAATAAPFYAKWQSAVAGEYAAFYLDTPKCISGSNNGSFLGMFLKTYSYKAEWIDKA